MENKAIFLDRDGVINKIVAIPELGILDSPLNPKQFKLLPRVSEAIRDLNSLGVKVVVISNQPSIAKGKMTLELFEKIRSEMIIQLRKRGAHIDREYYCLHHPKATLPEYRIDCECRKPKPGLLLKAKEDLNIKLSECYMIGDSLVDIEAGKRAGCKTILIGDFKCDLCKYMDRVEVRPDYIVANLFHASKIIKEVEKRDGTFP